MAKQIFRGSPSGRARTSREEVCIYGFQYVQTPLCERAVALVCGCGLSQIIDNCFRRASLCFWHCCCSLLSFFCSSRFVNIVYVQRCKSWNGKIFSHPHVTTANWKETNRCWSAVLYDQDKSLSSACVRRRCSWGLLWIFVSWACTTGMSAIANETAIVAPSSFYCF